MRLCHCGEVESRVSTLALLRLGTATMLRRGFQALRLRTALVAMISFASGVRILLSDDLSSVIFGQSTPAGMETLL